VIQDAMKHYGASNAIVYGVIPAVAPHIIVGTTVLGVAGSKADWRQFGTALTVVIAVSSRCSWDPAEPGWQAGSACSSQSSATPSRQVTGWCRW
jgi:hypothetical protein